MIHVKHNARMMLHWFYTCAALLVVLCDGQRIKRCTISTNDSYETWYQTVEEDSSCYLPSKRYETLSWYDAREYCQQRGGDLVSIESEYEELAVLKIARGSQGGMSNTWMGLFRPNARQPFAWADRTPLVYTNFDKKATSISTNKCAIMPTQTRLHQPQWRPENCGKKNGFVCKKYRTQRKFNETDSTGTDPNASLWKGWYKFGKKGYKVVQTALNYSEAASVCKSVYDAELASIDNQEQQRFITAVAGNYNTTDFWIGLKTVDLTTIGWENNNRFNYSNWMNGAPGVVFGSKCGSLHNVGFHAGRWKFGFCDEERPYICEQLIGSSEKPVKEAKFFYECDTDKDFIQYLGECYKVFKEPQSRDEAEVTCENNGGHLVSIANAHEHSFISAYTNMQNISEYWIGINSTDEANRAVPLMEWIDQSPMYFRSWENKHPLVNSKCAYAKTVDGKWTTSNECTISMPFVCKKQKNSGEEKPRHFAKGQCPEPLANRSGPGSLGTEVWVDVDRSAEHCYFYSNKTASSWAEAEFSCLQYGGHLVTFKDEEELKLVRALSLPPSESAWIGLFFRYDGTLQWVDGSPKNYMNLDDKRRRQSNHFCGQMSLEDFKWSLTVCQEWKTYFCAVKKV